jgi:hypothetical protein
LGERGDHLKLKIDDPETKMNENIATDAIAFQKGDLDKDLKIGDYIDIIAHLDLNTWANVTTPQLIVRDIIINGN